MNITFDKIPKSGFKDYSCIITNAISEKYYVTYVNLNEQSNLLLGMFRANLSV